MLSACGHGGRERIDLTGPAPDPVIKVETVRVPYCPGDLFRDTGDEPSPADGAVVEHNDAGGEYLDGLIGYAQHLLSIITASRQACADNGAAPE